MAELKASIKLIRYLDPKDTTGDYTVRIDDRDVATIQNGQEILLEISAGKHNMSVRTPSYESETLSFRIGMGQEFKFYTRPNQARSNDPQQAGQPFLILSQGIGKFTRGLRGDARARVVAENVKLIDQLAAECKSKYARKAIRIVLDENLKTTSLDASIFGEVRLSAPGEKWPYFDNTPMLPICQINIAELPNCPPLLEGIKLITYFCCDGEWLPEDNHLNRSCWELRAYQNIEGLIPLVPPLDDELTDDHRQLTPVPIRFEEFIDYPESGNEIEDELGVEGLLRDQIIISKGYSAITPEIESEISEIATEVCYRLGHQWCSKIGGWPTCIQGDPVCPGPPAFEEYVMQFSYENKAYWKYGDCGVISVKRGKLDGESCWYSLITCG